MSVLAGYTKNRELAVQPIPRARADRFAPWLATLPAGRPIFLLPARMADVIRVDLHAAGIEPGTPEGRINLHVLRGVYITNLVEAETSVKSVRSSPGPRT